MAYDSDNVPTEDAIHCVQLEREGRLGTATCMHSHHQLRSKLVL
jgi:hypothetical protein